MSGLESQLPLASENQPLANFAHSRPGALESEWERLEDHLTEVAALAAQFCSAFDSSQWGELGGLWHDLGKYRPEFQRRIRGSREQVEHAGAGAALASSRGLLPLAFVIAGHHAGLANYQAQADTDRRSLAERLKDSGPLLQTLKPFVPPAIFDHPVPQLPKFLSATPKDPNRAKLSVELWTRMLFSAVVDADRLCTERFYQPNLRDGLTEFEDLRTIATRLDTRLVRFVADTTVNRVRAEVLADCRRAAPGAQGIFALSVPTGGGKTLSAMAFALDHALKHQLSRVIVAVPYTTIIEQNASAYRDALGEHNVIEHHSAVDLAPEGGSTIATETDIRHRFATENWDAPVIVTTTVQLFESLFSSHPSRCRKLHNVARSVIIIDEAQTLPAGFLLCILDAMKTLVRDYGCTLVLSTATQPALQLRDSLPQGLSGVVEIAGNPEQLQQQLRRVCIEWRRPAVTMPYVELARELTGLDQVLAIVHLRSDARKLAELLPKEARFHLSALMCPSHRRQVLKQIRGALKAGGTCRTVTTQLVEAGVDIDFPVVFRALAGLDSLAQAAGRCNREGTLADGDGMPVLGRFVVFRAETKPPRGVLRRGLEETEKLLASYGDALDFTESTTMEAYFRGVYMATHLDKRNVQTERALLNFASVGDLVRLIEDGFTRSVVVPFGSAETAVADYRRWPTRRSSRALQQYVVQVRERDFVDLLDRGGLEEVEGFGHALTAGFHHLYSNEFGLVLSEDDRQDPSALIV